MVLSTEPDLHFPYNGDTTVETHRISEELDSTCSTPYVSAPSSPGRGPSCPSGYFFSAPASPVHFILSAAPSTSYESLGLPCESLASSGSFEFDFSSRFSPSGLSTGKGPMSSADELFLNGQIRPMKLSSHLERPQILSPLFDLNEEDEDAKSNRRISNCEKRDQQTVNRGRDLKLRNNSQHRKARSTSPLRRTHIERHEEENVDFESEHVLEVEVAENSKQNDTPSVETTRFGSASSSRSSSSGRNSKKWLFLKDLLLRSKSEGSGNYREKLWSSISFSPSKEKKLASPTLTPSTSRDEKEKNRTEMHHKQKYSKQVPAKKSFTGKPANGVLKRKATPSPHELHYTANRAQAEEMKKKTFLPYRQGLLGCLGFSSKGYGAFHGFTRTLNPVSSGSFV